MWPVRVYYEDTDAAGVVYYANYLKYLERARTEFLRARGYSQSALRRESGIVFAVRSLTLDFRRPARFDDSLQVRTRVADSGRASLSFAQNIYRLTAPGAEELLTQASVKVACLDGDAFRPRSIPPAMLETLRSEC